MHIAINGWFWDQVTTGSGQYVRRLVAGLNQIAPHIELSLVMPPHNAQPDAVPEGVNIVTTGTRQRASKLNKVWFEQRTFPRVGATTGADLLHVPYWGAPLSSPLPIVTSVLDMIPVMYPAYMMGVFNRLYVSLVSASARGSDYIITISHTSAVDIEEHLDIPRERISVTYLATDSQYHPRMGAENDEMIREKYNLPEQFVLYLGSFDMRKQVNELLLAYTYVGEAEGENIPLVLAGKEPAWREPVFPDLREYTRRLNIQDYVRWVGFIDEADKPALYRLADVFVFPSAYEGFGLPPLEAMACGTPVVAFDTVISDEVLQDGAYLVSDARHMAGAIIALLLQQPLRETMINQGLAQVTKYNWRNTARETLRVYERVLRDNT